MTNIPSPETTGLPEQLISSSVVGEISANTLPWLSESEAGAKVSISEAVFPDGSIYIASAIPKKLAKFTEEVREKDPYLSPDGKYSRLDEFYLQAAHLEANSEAIRSPRVRLLNGRSDDFQGLTIKTFGESPKPNTRRMYYMLTGADQLTDFKPASETPLKPNQKILIRLGYADKQNQLGVLRVLTGKNVRQLKDEGAGSV